MGGELWDVTDAEGTPVGVTHRRGDPGFPAGRFHIVASVCVVRGVEQLEERLSDLVAE